MVKKGQKDEGVRHPINVQPLEILGGADRDRTGDLQSAILALSQLSYCPTILLEVMGRRLKAKKSLTHSK
jgi:hypothetical protein